MHLTKLVEGLNDAARGIDGILWKFLPPGALMVYRRVTPEGSWTVTRPEKSLQI